MLGVLDRGLAGLSVIATAFVVVLLFVGPSLIGAQKSSTAGITSGTGGSAGSGSGAKGAGASGSGAGAGQAKVSGAAVFASAGCAGCHTLKAAGATGTIGPDLDQLRPSAATVSGVVRSGAGAMPSFSGKLSDAQIAAVASYVSSVAGQ